MTKIGAKNKDNRQKAPTDMVDANPAMPAISLNFSDPNVPVKR